MFVTELLPKNVLALSVKPIVDDEKWLIEPQELTLDEPAEVSMEVPPESAPSEVEPVGRPKRKVVPPPRLLEEM